jgi:MFS family permease
VLGTREEAAPRAARSRRLFYGWWIVLACGAIQILGSGCFYYGLGAFFLPLTAEFGWSRALTSSAFSLYRLEGGVVEPIVGFAFDRIGPRRLIALGVTLAGAGFVIFSRIDSFAGFVVAVVVMATGFSCGFGSVGMATVANWFNRRRTIALGLLMTGAGIGGSMVPVLAWTIESQGWRTAALVVGCLIFGAGLPLSFLVRHRPEELGLRPDGEKAGVSRRGLGAPSRSRPVEASAPVRDALRSRAFWLIAVASSLAMVAQSALIVHAIPHLTGVGLAATSAAGVVAAMTLISIGGRIGFGWVGDRFEKRKVMAALYGLQACGLLVFAVVDEPWQVIPFLCLYAPSYGGTIPLRPSLQAEQFGRGSFGAIQGLLNSCSSVAAMLGPVLAGWVFDVSATYRPAFLALAIVAGLAAPVILSVPRSTLGRPAAPETVLTRRAV